MPQICANGGAETSPAPSARSPASASAGEIGSVEHCERMPIARTRVAPRRIAGLNGATCRSAPSPKKSSPVPQSSATGGKTIGIAADAHTWSTPSSTGSTMRRLRDQTGCPGRPCTNVNERPE